MMTSRLFCAVLVAVLAFPLAHAQSIEPDAAASALVPDTQGGSAAWGDYTGDGLADLVVRGVDADGNHFGRVFKSDGVGGLVEDEAASALVPGVSNGSVAWGDYTGDGLADLVITGTGDGLVGRVFKGDGQGGLVEDLAASALVPDVFHSSVAWGDYTGDGLADLVVTGLGSGKVGNVYRSDGPNGLVEDEAASALIPDMDFSSVAWGDYTGDGLADLVVTGQAGSSTGRLYRSDGQGGLEEDVAASALIPEVERGAVAWGDYTGDGIVDLVVTGYNFSGIEASGGVFRGIPAPPVNDAFANAAPITAVGTVAGSNVSATVEDGEPEASCLTSGSTGASVWWVFQPTATATVTLDFASSDFDTVVSLYAVEDQTLAEVACNDDIVPGTTVQSRLEDVPVEANGTYVIRVAGYDNGTGPAQGAISFELTIGAPPPANDALASAIGSLPPGESVTATNVSATLEDGEPVPSCQVSTGASVWWWFEAPAAGTVTFDFASSDFDTVVSLYPDTNPDLPTAASELACNDDAVPGTTVQSRLVDVPVEGGAQYALRVAGYDPGVDGPAMGAVAFDYTFTPAVASEEDAEAAFALAVSPNPVASSAEVSVTLASPTDVTVEVVDALGRRVAVLADGPQPAGASSWRWDAGGHPSGVYVVRLRAGDEVHTQRVTVVR